MEQDLIQETLRLSRDPRLGPLQRRALLEAPAMTGHQEDLMGIEAVPTRPKALQEDPLPYAPPLPKLKS